MILFPKIYKTLLILWIGLCCPLIFSAPLLFDPMLFSPHHLPSQVMLPQNTPITPLCPPGISIQMCMAFSSFPLVQTSSNNTPSSTMFTPFVHKPKDISPRRRRRLLSRNKWKSYAYSNEDHELRGLSETEKNVEPEDDYYRMHIQEKPETNNIPQVIQESKTNGQQRIHVGELRAIETAEILRSIEPAPVPEPPQEPPQAPATESPQTPAPVDHPQTTPKPPAEKEIEEEEEEETAQPIVLKRATPAIALNYNSIPNQCADIRSGDTEAVSICADCSLETNRKLQRDSATALGYINIGNNENPRITDADTFFNVKLEQKLRGKICHGQNFIKPVKNSFENNCGNISFEDYVSEVLICESCKNKVPPALMLSMMSLESLGKCTSSGDDGTSHGLFQINIKYHKDPPTCSPQQQEKIRQAQLAELKTSLRCLGNPVANIQKSIEILTDFYQTVSGSQNNFDCQSSDMGMDTQKTNQWRKALAGYNGGNYFNRLKNMPKPKAIPEEQWSKMDEWEKIRVQYFFNKGLDPKRRMQNLAHVETALGNSGDSQGQLNLFNSWEQALENKIDTSKCQ